MALSREPSASSPATASEITIAGTLISPPAIGPASNASGTGQPAELDDAGGITGPADRDGAADDGVFEDQRPADDPGEQLAERDVGVGVRAAGHRHHRRHLGVRERRAGADDAGDDERQDHCRPRHARRRRRSACRCRCRRCRRRRARPGAASSASVSARCACRATSPLRSSCVRFQKAMQRSPRFIVAYANGETISCRPNDRCTTRAG